MSIQHAILGILSVRPLTGYDVKKVMQDSPFMYWSGNNNQVYKALVALHDEGFVTQETQHQDGAPSRKVYTITEAGLAELRRWSLSTPDLPELKKPFLVQLAWSWQLRGAELSALLDQYEEAVRGRLLVEQGQANAPDRTPREAAVWALIDENVIDTYERELQWIQRVRRTVARFPDAEAQPVIPKQPQQEDNMQYTVMQENTKTYLHVHETGRQLQTEQDALDLIALCAQHGTNLLLIDGGALPDDFFRLRTGLAGAVAQKFAQYAIRAAIVLDPERTQGKFKEFIAESNRGHVLRAYASAADATGWLLKG